MPPVFLRWHPLGWQMVYIYVYTYIYVYAHIEDLSAGAVYCQSLILKCSKTWHWGDTLGRPPWVGRGFIYRYVCTHIYVCMYAHIEAPSLQGLCVVKVEQQSGA